MTEEAMILIDEIERLKAALRKIADNVYVCTDHDGHYPVGVCSIVVANSEAQARDLLTLALVAHGLDGAKPFTLRLLQTDKPQAFVLLDGDY